MTYLLSYFEMTLLIINYNTIILEFHNLAVIDVSSVLITSNKSLKTITKIIN